jgi:Glycosidases
MDKKIIYQVFTRVCCNETQNPVPYGSIHRNGCGKMNGYTSEVLKGIRETGVTHIWFTGLLAHASRSSYSKFGIPESHHSTVKGEAGSPYAIRDYYDIDPDLAESVPDRMQEFMQLVQRVHEAGMKIIMDFVPNHVAREYCSVSHPEGVADLGENDDPGLSFSPGNNFYYITGQQLSGEIDWGDYSEFPAKATGNDRFSSTPSKSDWYETVKLNYGVDYQGGGTTSFNPIPDTWFKMRDILRFWASKQIDGFRCDMAEMVPAAFWTWATDKVKYQYPEMLFIGEVYDPNQYRTYIGAGFDYLYDKVGMYDCIRDVICGKRSTTDITSQWQATDDIRNHMLYFLENHDEQRIASDFFAGKAEKGIPGLIVSVLLQQNPFMLYAGQEYGERGMDEEGFSGKDGRTTIFDYWCVDTLARAEQRKLTKEEKALKAMYDKVLNIARSEKSVAEGASFDLMYVNQQYQRQYAFLRKSDTEVLLVVANFEEQSADMDVTIPAHAFDYLQIKEKNAIATDLLSGKKKRIVLRRDETVSMQLPPLGAVVLKFKA